MRMYLESLLAYNTGTGIWNTALSHVFAGWVVQMLYFSTRQRHRSTHTSVMSTALTEHAAMSTSNTPVLTIRGV